MAGVTVTVLHTTPNEGVDPEVGKVQLDAPLDIEQLMAKTMEMFEIGRPAVRWKGKHPQSTVLAILFVSLVMFVKGLVCSSRVFSGYHRWCRMHELRG